ncbi:MAG: hypothetical protein ABIC91_03770 [Nanoarchaeota archaeon]|nr:hypothetical protein [Nanoarchaeota archaeon]MBU1849478.1 hypothetical protein [Nanoarchaeota archaeon]
MNIDNEYKKIATKYALPSLLELDKEFHIGNIDNQTFILREIVKKLIEKIESYGKLLEELINPEGSLTSMHEANFFDEEDKKLAMINYKKLLFYHRLELELDLYYEEEKFASFIKTFYEEWQKMKKDLVKIISKMKESWKKDLKNKVELGYFG